VHAVPAHYRLTLQDDDGREEDGAFRRFRADAPRVGHRFTTVDHGSITSWEVTSQRLVRERDGQVFVEYCAEREVLDTESPPDHQLEHALEQRREWSMDSPTRLLALAETTGRLVELVSLEPGQAPDWDAAARFLDALVVEEVGDNLFELCGVDTRRHPEGEWLGIVQERLRADLDSFRRDIEGDHAAIGEWDFRGGRVFAAVGAAEDEASPASGYGWMCRLVDSDVLGAAGFARVRKASLDR
jgi:hypothetical protein